METLLVIVTESQKVSFLAGRADCSRPAAERYLKTGKVKGRNLAARLAAAKAELDAVLAQQGAPSPKTAA